MLLRKDDPWPPDMAVPDVRDWRVVDESGRAIGFVQTLVVDAAEGTMAAILTGPNDRYDAGDIDILQDRLRVRKTLSQRSRPDGAAPAAYRRYGDAYRDHFERTYAGEAMAFGELAPAYEFGRQLSQDSDFSRRPYDRAAEDVRAAYAARGLPPRYADAEQAVAFAYRLAQDPARTGLGGMDSEGRQIIEADEPAPPTLERSGNAMSTGSPAGQDRSASGSS